MDGHESEIIMIYKCRVCGCQPVITKFESGLFGICCSTSEVPFGVSGDNEQQVISCWNINYGIAPAENQGAEPLPRPTGVRSNAAMNAQGFGEHNQNNVGAVVECR